MGSTVEILVERPGLHLLAGDDEVKWRVAISLEDVAGILDVEKENS